MGSVALQNSTELNTSYKLLNNRAMETLLEDYKRKLKSVNELISKQRSNGSIVHQRREERLNTKASEYRAFIVDIERSMARTLNEAKATLPINSVVFSEAELKAKLEEQKEEHRQWLEDEGYELLAERL